MRISSPDVAADLSFGPLLEMGVTLGLLMAAGWVQRPESAGPLLTLGALLLTTTLIRNLWRAAEGTALRGTIIWVWAAMAWGVICQVVAAFEPLSSGRPWASQLTYLTSLMALAALLSVLNARRPGAGAWSWLMLALVVLFLIPLLEAGGFARRVAPLARLHLEMPWSLFYGLLAVVGTLNYVATRQWLGALALLFGLMAQLVALVDKTMTPQQWPTSCGHVFFLLTFGLFAFDPRWPAARGVHYTDATNRLWFWFRDRWGAAWGLRVRDRFNREATVANHAFRLTWRGLVPHGEPARPLTADEQAAAAQTLRMLLKHFAEPWKLEQVLAGD